MSEASNMDATEREEIIQREAHRYLRESARTERAPTPGPLLSEEQFRKHLWALLVDNRPLAFATGRLPAVGDALLADREERQRAAQGYADLVAAVQKYLYELPVRVDLEAALAQVTGAGE
jgi:hypothetical protein